MGQLPLSPRVLGVVLAAGAGRRMGGPKALLVVEGTRLLDRATAVLRAGGCDGVGAIVPPGVVASPGVLTVENPSAQTGMRSSLELAVTVAQGYDAVAVTLVDTTGVSVEAVGATVAAWRADPSRIYVAQYNGRRAHPAVMTTERWAAAVELADADEGARRYLQAHAADVVDVAAPGDAVDLDTPEDLARWLAR